MSSSKDNVAAGRQAEEEILALAARGDRAAEEYLAEKYQRFVQYKCKGYFLLDGDQDDVFQEGMIGLIEAIRKYEPDKNMSFLAFVDLCVTRQLMTAVKSSGRKKNQPLNTGISLYSESQSDLLLMQRLVDQSSLNPETAFIRSEDLRIAMEYLRQSLTDCEKEIFFAYLQGYTYRQIAQQVGKSIKAVDNTLQRVRKKLSDFLQTLHDAI